MRDQNTERAVAAIERAHALNMSADPSAAMQGRLAKEFVALTDRWMRDELERSKTPEDLKLIILAAASGATSFMMSVMHTVFQGRPPAEVIDDTASLLAEMIRSGPERVADQVKAQMEMV